MADRVVDEAQQLKAELKEAKAINVRLRMRNRDLELKVSVDRAMVHALRLEHRPLKVVSDAAGVFIVVGWFHSCCY